MHGLFVERGRSFVSFQLVLADVGLPARAYIACDFDAFHNGIRGDMESLLKEGWD